MKVLFNVYPIAFDCPGGGEIQLLKTKEALTRSGVDVALYNQWEPQLGWAEVVHYFSVFGGSSVFCNYVKAKGLPLAISPVLWPRGDTSGYPMDEIRWLLNQADILFPNSRIEAEALSEVFSIPIEKFHVTYNGIDDLFLADDQPSPELFRKKFEIEGPFALCVGNIENRKNQIRLAEAAARLKLKTLLIGNVRDQNFLEQTLKAGQGYVRYLGSIPHHDPLLRSAYRACDVFVLPSTLETPGLAALEAAAMGAKVVVTEVGATREYFEDGAMYVSPLSVNSIASELDGALAQAARPQLRERVRNFSWRRTAEQAIAGYLKVI